MSRWKRLDGALEGEPDQVITAALFAVAGVAVWAAVAWPRPAKLAAAAWLILP